MRESRATHTDDGPHAPYGLIWDRHALAKPKADGGNLLRKHTDGNEHLSSTLNSHELDEQATVRIFRIVQTEGSRQVSRDVKHSSLDAIIAVGFRVNSVRAVEFRQWAVHILRNFALRGYVIDRDRLESGQYIGEDYFEQLLQEVHEILLDITRLHHLTWLGSCLAEFEVALNHQLRLSVSDLELQVVVEPGLRGDVCLEFLCCLAMRFTSFRIRVGNTALLCVLVSVDEWTYGTMGAHEP